MCITLNVYIDSYIVEYHSINMVLAKLINIYIYELQAKVNSMHEYRYACLLAFTETWLDDHVQVSNLLIA